MKLLDQSIAWLAVPLALLVGRTLNSASPLQNDVQPLYEQLDALVTQHQYARAEQILNQHLAGGQDPPIAYFQLGKIYFDHENWQRSVTFLEKSLHSRGTNDYAHQLLGLAWRELRRPDAAEAELLEAAKQNPSNKVNVYLAGHQLLLNGKFDAALPYLYSALECKPLYFQTLQALGLAQARLGNYGLAESYYRKAIDAAQISGDSNYPALMNLSILLLLGHDSTRLQEALNCAQRCEKLKPESPDPHFLAGKALFKLGRPAEAVPKLAQAEKLNPQEGKTHFLLAKIYDHLNEPDLARKERKAFARAQGHPEQAGMSAVDPVPVMPEDLPKAVHH